MECPICKASLIIASAGFTSEIGETAVYHEAKLVCANSECDNYAGEDLSNPRVVVTTQRGKVN